MIVTSAAVPAVVGTAIMGTLGFFVSIAPSREVTSAYSGLFMMIPIAFAVSIDEPPPIAIMQSGSNRRMAFAPSCAQASVGSGATS